jgi:diacylglycerol kinase (ATP)
MPSITEAGSSKTAESNAGAVSNMSEESRRRHLRVLVCTSPKAGSGGGREGISNLVKELTSRGIPAEITTDIGRVREVSGFRDANFSPNNPNTPVIVTAGGDGTLALVAQNTPPSTTLVPMPLGTENLLARHFGYRSQTDAMIDTLLHGRDKSIDAGSANGKIFLVMATCGFDAEVVRAMHLRRKGHINRFSYTGPILRTLRRYRFPPLTVTWLPEPTDSPPANECSKACEPTGESLANARERRTGVNDQTIGDLPPEAHVCRWAMVFNLPRYAASLPIERNARGDDGLLNYYGLEAGSIVSGIRYLCGIVTGRHIHWSDVRRQPITGCRITSPESVSYQLDGDYAGRLPLEIRVLPQYIKLRLPTTCPPERS